MKAIVIGFRGVLIAGASLLASVEQSFSQPTAPDEAAITSPVESFHKALETGLPDKVMALLAPDAFVVEAGNIQTRSDYQREHLADDIAFAHAVPVISRKIAAVRQEGNVAWVTGTSRAVGEFIKGSLIAQQPKP
jgi:hypothetical protein